MGLIDYLKARFIGTETIEINAKDVQNYIDSEKMKELCTQEFFTMVAISLLSNILAGCEFRTCINKEEVYEEEYYLWNFEPNQNQSAAEFKKQIIDTLIRKNEALIIEVGKYLYVADSYTIREENAFEEKVFYNIVVQNTTLPYEIKMSGVLYIKLNNRNIKAMLDGVTEGYQKVAQNAMEEYAKRGGEKGIMHIDTVAQNKKYGNRTFNEVYEELLNDRFKKYFTNKNAVLPLFEGFTYESKTKASINKGEAGDYSNMIDEIAAKTGIAFHIPPQLLIGKVEGLKDAVKNLLSFAIDPMASMIQTEVNRKRYKEEVLNGSYMWIDTSKILHIDLFEIAEKIDKLIASGMTSIDELRKHAGMLELGTEESTKHFITKNYQEITKGGKENEDKPEDDAV